MPTETVNIDLPQSPLSEMRQAVQNGEYLSNSEVIQDVLEAWSEKRHAQLDIPALRNAWDEALAHPGPYEDADVVFDNLEKRYARTSGGRTTT